MFFYQEVTISKAKKKKNKKLQLLTVDIPESSTASREMNVRGKKEIPFSTGQFILDLAKYSTVLEDSFLVTIISIPMHKKA